MVEYRSAANLAPDEPSYQQVYGVALRKLGQFAEAAKALNKSLAADPADAETHWQLGTTLEAEHRYAEARPAFEQAVALNPDEGRYHLSLGTIWRRIGQRARAFREVGANIS